MKWAERLRRAHERGSFTPDDVIRSWNWLRCPCGERGYNASHIYRRAGDELVIRDSEAYQLGNRFAAACTHHRVAEAQELYDRISALPKISIFELNGIHA